jgi:four helix bundle protein
VKYNRFEDLPVWNAAIDLAVRVLDFSEMDAFAGKHGLKDQLTRAAVSISNNIAEGFESGTTQQLLSFLYVARGSAGETRSMLCLLERLPGFAPYKVEIGRMKTAAEGVSRQLTGWANSLQNSDMKGQRYQTDRARSQQQRSKERKEFLEELRKTTAQARGDQ